MQLHAKEHRCASTLAIAKNFMIFNVSDGKIVSEESVSNPGHRPGFLPNFLGDMGVGVMIAGGIGGGAIEIFNERGIPVITGAQGNARAAAEAYVNGTLQSTNTAMPRARPSR